MAPVNCQLDTWTWSVMQLTENRLGHPQIRIGVKRQGKRWQCPHCNRSSPSLVLFKKHYHNNHLFFEEMPSRPVHSPTFSDWTDEGKVEYVGTLPIEIKPSTAIRPLPTFPNSSTKSRREIEERIEHYIDDWPTDTDDDDDDNHSDNNSDNQVPTLPFDQDNQEPEAWPALRPISPQAEPKDVDFPSSFLAVGENLLASYIQEQKDIEKTMIQIESALQFVKIQIFNGERTTATTNWSDELDRLIRIETDSYRKKVNLKIQISYLKEKVQAMKRAKPWQEL